MLCDQGWPVWGAEGSVYEELVPFVEGKKKAFISSKECRFVPMDDHCSVSSALSLSPLYPAWKNFHKMIILSR